MFSYGTGNVIKLDEYPVLQLVGNNGAGKSSIPTILEELLYNKNSRGVKKGDIKNRYVDDTYYSGSVKFTMDGSEYELSKMVKSTASVKLLKDGEDISGHTATQTYKMLETEILQLEFNTFSKLVYQSMNSSLDFLKTTDSNRKKFLISLLSLERYVIIHDKLKESVKDAKSSLDNLKGKMDSVTEAINSVKLPLEMKEVPTVPEVDQDLLTRAADIKAKLEDADRVKKLIQRHETLKAKLSKIENETIAEAEEPITIESKVREDKQKLLLQAQSLGRDIKDIQSNISALKRGVGSCSSCGQKLPSAESNAEKIEAETQKLQELKNQLELIPSTDKYDKELKKHQAFKQYQVDVKDYDSRLAGARESLESLGDVPTTYDNVTQGEYNSIKAEYDEQVALQSSVTKQVIEIEKHNSTVEERYNQLKANKALKVKLQTDLEKATSKYNMLKVLQNAFGPKGLIQYKIESNIKVFEGMINEYLVLLSNGDFNINFVIEDSKLKISVFQHGEEININSASSGEFNNINTATLLAVRKMMSSISKVSINLLMLDEVISVLDVHARENLIEILIKEQNLNSIVVSHGFEHPLAESLNIIKEGKISKCHRN